MTYFRPSTLSEALAIRADRDVTVIAGCTDIYPARTTRQAWGDPVQGDILDITAVSGLDRIAESDDAFRIGCLVTWTDLIRAPLPALFDGYKRAAREVGGIQVQNRGTLVGNICTASPAGDGLPNLLVLDAKVELASRSGTRFVPISTFVDGYRHTVLRPDEIVTAVIVPKLADARSDFRKLGARKYLVISIAMAAGLVIADEAGRIAMARIAVGACSAVAQRLTRLEAALLGTPLSGAAALLAAEHVEGLAPIDDVRASADYRNAAALMLTRDLLAHLATDPIRRAA